MNPQLDCFLPLGHKEDALTIIEELRHCPLIGKIYLMCPTLPSDTDWLSAGCHLLECQTPFTHPANIAIIHQQMRGDYALVYTQCAPLKLGYRAIERMLHVAYATNADMVYSDYLQREGDNCLPHPLIEFQWGCVRSDFDFGPLQLLGRHLLGAETIHNQGYEHKHTGLYLLQLELSREEKSAIHLSEPLYTIEESDHRTSGEKQFDYVNPSQAEAQKEMEQVFTEWLKGQDAYIHPDELFSPDLTQGDFPYEASVIIPVRNRVRTIADAIRSAMAQKTDFTYNIIVVDNHSTDGTTEAIANLAKGNTRLIHLCPERTDLGIGGCWNLAIHHPQCGRFAVQLDSDDLYSSDATLQTMVNAFYEQKAAMVVGSYRMTDFNLQTLPPGVIDHREWTAENGHNNLLRVNGIGAPRAFFTPVLRNDVETPNISYGEDYSIALTISRTYRIGRVFDVVYLCRRWDGNSDANLNVQQVNAHNQLKDKLRIVELKARQKGYWQTRYGQYNPDAPIQEKKTETGFIIQQNAKRIKSATADIAHTEKRPCFLCKTNRPTEQLSCGRIRNFTILENPYPVLDNHLTIVANSHVRQTLAPQLSYMIEFSWAHKHMMVFYNGAKCGASAPDHAHFQAGAASELPLLSRTYPTRLIAENDTDGKENLYLICEYACPAFRIDLFSQKKDSVLLKKLLEALPCIEGEDEPRMNVIAQRSHDKRVEKEVLHLFVIPRSKHRPDCYYAKGDEQLLVSPASLEMAGLFPIAREEDFPRMDEHKVTQILKEVSLPEKEIEKVCQQVKKLLATNKG